MKPKPLAYESPLNEYIRTYLRIERLGLALKQSRLDKSPEGVRETLSSLVDIGQVLDRNDLKSHLLKDLDRQLAKFSAYKNNPKADSAKLSRVLGTLESLISQLHEESSRLGQALRQDDFLMMVRHQCATPGGGSSFDAPLLHHFIHQESSQSDRALDTWTASVSAVLEGASLILSLLRETMVMSSQEAPQSFFQETLPKENTCQLVRVLLPEGSPYYPEISLGKHQIYVRFCIGSSHKKSEQATETVTFQLGVT